MLHRWLLQSAPPPMMMGYDEDYDEDYDHDHHGDDARLAGARPSPFFLHLLSRLEYKLLNMFWETRCEMSL